MGQKEVWRKTNTTILRVEPRIYTLKLCIDYLVLLTIPSSFLFLSILPFSFSLGLSPYLLSDLSSSFLPLLSFHFSQLKVTHKQLALLLGAFAAYFSGNHTAVEGFMKEFHSKIQELQSNRDPPEWLEELPSPQDQQSN